MPGPVFNARQNLMAQVDPVQQTGARPAGAAPVRGPIELLGLAAGQDVVHLSELARALSGLDAAQTSIYPPPPVPEGLGIQLDAPGSAIDVQA